MATKKKTYKKTQKPLKQTEEKQKIVLTEEEMKEREKLIKYFTILFWMSVALCVVGLAFMIFSFLLGTFNFVFGLLGIYFSRRYLKRLKPKDKDGEEKKSQGDKA